MPATKCWVIYSFFSYELRPWSMPLTRPISVVKDLENLLFIGNHEYYSGQVDKWFEELTSLGFNVLHNSHVQVPQDSSQFFYLAGVDDLVATLMGWVPNCGQALVIKTAALLCKAGYGNFSHNGFVSVLQKCCISHILHFWVKENNKSLQPTNCSLCITSVHLSQTIPWDDHSLKIVSQDFLWVPEHAPHVLVVTCFCYFALLGA